MFVAQAEMAYYEQVLFLPQCLKMFSAADSSKDVCKCESGKPIYHTKTSDSIRKAVNVYCATFLG